MVVRALLLAFAIVMLATRPAHADIVVEFYSYDFGRNFPHAFLKAKGTWNQSGKPVNETYGFTAKRITPAVLAGPVPGGFEPIPKQALTVSKLRFSVVVKDAQYQALLAVVAKWRERPEKNYDLDHHNCVHFVGEAAQALGLKVTFPKQLMKSPRKYLEKVAAMNALAPTAKPRAQSTPQLLQPQPAPTKKVLSKTRKTLSIY
jgi:hypothetical protein